MATRFAGVVIALLLVVAGGVLLRRSQTAGHGASARDESGDSASNREVSKGRGDHEEIVRHTRSADGEPARPERRVGGASQRTSDTERAATHNRDSGEALAIGSRRRSGGSVASSAEDARRREDAVRNMPGARRAPDDSPDGDTVAPLPDGLPRGTRFSAALNGNTGTADNHEPIVEKNLEHDGNDGIYFSPDAQLAYANRAGVQDDAGTVALWVEPVDWEGKDGTVRSFFRLNDPSSDNGYRFHLLKDSASLRFQFVTDQGEANVRVPIDWWPQGEGHYVAATWEDNVLRLYVDGAQMGEQAYKGTLMVSPSAPGWWGSSLSNGTSGAGAVLKDTLVTDRSLTQNEIQTLWEGG